jgi:hypothetical protein
MAIDISHTLYRRKDIRLSTRICLEELAKMAQPDGTVRVAYSYLAYKMNVCKRTAMRCIATVGRLGGILRKFVRRRDGSAFHEMNTYKFIIKFRRFSAHPFNGDNSAKMPSTPNTPREQRKESLHDVREELRRQERLLRVLDLTPGSPPYEAAHGEIARLKALVDASEPVNTQERR